MEDYFSKGKLNFNQLVNLRRQAYVDVLMASSSGEKILGIFANDYDEARIRAFGLIPVPLEGLDSGIFAFGSHRGCDVIKSTLIYLKTDKCPILHGSIAYAFDDFCQFMVEEFSKVTDKEIFVRNKSGDFDDFCQQIGSPYSADDYNKAKAILDEIGSIQNQLKEKDINGSQLMALDFFTKFIIDLEARLEFFKKIDLGKYEDLKEARKEVKVLCPWGIGFEIEKNISQNNYELIIDDKEPVFGVKDCIKNPKIKLSYQEG